MWEIVTLPLLEIVTLLFEIITLPFEILALLFEIVALPLLEITMLSLSTAV